MTQEYQANILTQLVEKVEAQTGVNVPQFQNGSDTTTELQTFIQDNGHTGDLTLQFYVSRNNKFVLFYNEYSGYTWTSSFVVITDEELNPVAIINSYYSGTNFTSFNQTITNDTGEGRIYFTNLQNRLYYVNDPTSKKLAQPYEMRILSSYSMQLTGSLLSFKKNKDGGNFAFATWNSTNNHVYITEFVNNVGMPSEWNTYEYDYNELYFTRSLDFYPLWNDGFSCRVVYLTTIEGQSNSVIKVLQTQEQNSVKSLVLQKSINTEFNLTIEKSLLLSYTKFVYVTTTPSNTKDIHIVYLDEEIDTNLKTFTNSTVEIKVLNNNLFVKQISRGNSTSVLNIGMLHNGAYYEHTVANITDSGNPTIPFFILNTFNLYTFIFSYGDDVYKTFLVYNVNNYNGQSFIDQKSVVCNSGVLYDANNNPIFARNLYNKSFIGNTEVDTINVPNFLLNTTTIAKETTFSVNNNEIIEQTQSITKNQYENLFLNFFNTITIIDRNSTIEEVKDVASAYFLNAINTNNQNKIIADKYKITFQDGTSLTNTISNVSINGLEATLAFMINVDKTVKKIEILSHDETMVYATIPSYNYTIGSTYKIEQQIIIE